MSTESKRDSGKKFLEMAQMGEWTPIPEKLPISGKRGAEKLYRLRRRTQYLQKRINEGSFGRGDALNRARAELAATEWILKTFMMYEELLKKGPPEESEDIKTEVTGLTPPTFELQHVTSF